MSSSLGGSGRGQQGSGSVSVAGCRQHAPRLVAFVVQEAVQLPNIGWTADVATHQHVFVRAVTDPDNGAVWRHLQWRGNVFSFPDQPNWCAVPRDRMGPVPVAVTLGDDEQGVIINIVPRVVRVDVQAPAQLTAPRAYTALTNATPLTAVVVTDPDENAAWQQVQWNGGHAGATANVRLYDRAAAGVVGIFAALPRSGDVAQVTVIRPPVVRLDNITFSNNRRLHRDNGMPRPQPEWTRGAGTIPLCFNRRTRIRLVPYLTVTAAGSADVDATLYGRMTIAGQPITFQVASPIRPADPSWSGAIDADADLPDTVLGELNVPIVWTIRIGGEPEAALDTATFDLFAMLAPSSAVVPDYHTCVAISCVPSSGRNTAADVITLPFANVLATRNTPRSSDAVQLTYWNPNTTMATGTALMLAHAQGSGQCGAWAEFTRDMWAMHGIPSTKVEVRALARFEAEQHAPQARYPGRDCEVFFGIHPVPGQGNAAPPPAFSNHFIVREGITGRYYDPSYGTGPFADVAAWRAPSVPGAQWIAPNGRAYFHNSASTIAGPATVTIIEAGPHLATLTIPATCTVTYHPGNLLLRTGAPFPESVNANVILPAGTVIGYANGANGAVPVPANHGIRMGLNASIVTAVQATAVVLGGTRITAPIGVEFIIPPHAQVRLEEDLTLWGDADVTFPPGGAARLVRGTRIPAGSVVSFPNGLGVRNFTLTMINATTTTLPAGITLRFGWMAYLGTGGNRTVFLPAGAEISRTTAAEGVHAVNAWEHILRYTHPAASILGADRTGAVPDYTVIQIPAGVTLTIPQRIDFTCSLQLNLGMPTTFVFMNALPPRTEIERG